MSVPKSKRSKSKVEFEMIYFNVAHDIDNFVEHSFYASGKTLENNKTFIERRSLALSSLTDDLLLDIKIANSIYPVCKAELEERRMHISKAIGICYTILAQYTRIMEKLRIKDDKYVDCVDHVIRLINSLRTWKKSDNRFKELV